MLLSKETSPRRIGQYVLGARLGGGGMGDVYVATHEMMKSRRVAIKLLKARLVTAPFVQRFFREIELLGAVKAHPNLVRAEYADIADDLPFLVMEHVPGIDLGELVRRQGALSVGAACELIRQAALGLAAIHEAGLVHRDLKPSNLMLTPDRVVKILDLGLARLQVTEETREDLTSAHCMLGTIDYMAPEQADNPTAVDIRADIYSLGCTLYKLLTGLAPYAEHPTQARKIHAHAHEPFPPVADPGVQVILARMTAKHPKDRYAAPEDVAKDLAALTSADCLSELVVTASAPPKAVDDAMTGTVPSGLQEASTVDQRPLPKSGAPVRRRWFWCAVTTLGLMGLLALGLVVYFRPAPPVVEPEPRHVTPSPPPVAPPVAPPSLRPLDELEPFLLHPLLERAPLPAVWNRAGGDAEHRFDAGKQQFSLSQPHNALFHLGKVHSPDFAFEIKLNQARWAPGCGICWGYRTDNLRPRFSGEAVFQFLLISKRTDPQKGELFFLDRGRGEVMTDEHGQKRIELESMYQSPLDYPFDEQLLTIKIAQQRLQHVMMQGKPLHKIVSPAANQAFEAVDYAGCIGVMSIRCNVVFRQALIKLEPRGDR